MPAVISYSQFACCRVDKGVLTIRMHKKRPRFEDVVID